MKLPNRFFFVGLLVGLVIAAGATLAFPSSASRVAFHAFRVNFMVSIGASLHDIVSTAFSPQWRALDHLHAPRFPDRPPIGWLNQRLQRVDGGETSLSEFQEKILFVNFWATWCAPCVEEMPSIESLADHFPDADVAFLLISKETADTVREFVEDQDLAVPVYTISDSGGSLWAGTIPATFIFDETRQVVFSQTGAAQWDDESSIAFLQDLLKDGASETDLPVQGNAGS